MSYLYLRDETDLPINIVNTICDYMGPRHKWCKYWHTHMLKETCFRKGHKPREYERVSILEDVVEDINNGGVMMMKNNIPTQLLPFHKKIKRLNFKLMRNMTDIDVYKFNIRDIGVMIQTHNNIALKYIFNTQKIENIIILLIIKLDLLWIFHILYNTSILSYKQCKQNVFDVGFFYINKTQRKSYKKFEFVKKTILEFGPLKILRFLTQSTQYLFDFRKDYFIKRLILGNRLDMLKIIDLKIPTNSNRYFNTMCDYAKLKNRECILDWLHMRRGLHEFEQR